MFLRATFAITALAITAGVLAFRSDPEFFGSTPWLHLVSDEVGIEPPPTAPYDSQQIHAAGVVEGGSQATDLRFEVQGRITHLACSDELAQPQRVRKGQVLAQIDHTCALQAVNEAKAMLAKANAEKLRLEAGASAAELDEARAEVKAATARFVSAHSTRRRLQSLSNEQVVSHQELDDAAANYRTAHARWAVAKARLVQLEDPPRPFELAAADAEIALAKSRVEQTKAMLRKSVLRAPCDALVLRVDGELGELTGPDTSIPLIALVDASALHVRAYVDELDAIHVKPGQRAEVTVDSLPDVCFRGHVQACLASMQSKTLLRHSPTEKLDVKVREVVITLDVANEHLNRLVFGLPVDVRVHTRADAERPHGGRDSEVLHANDLPAPATRFASTR